jgi:hypothetical protein
MCVWSPGDVESRAEEVAQEGQKFKLVSVCLVQNGAFSVM